MCIDTVLRRMREKDTLDIFGVVCAMRLQRNHMVQTEVKTVYIVVLDFVLLLKSFCLGSVHFHTQGCLGCGEAIEPC